MGRLLLLLLLLVPVASYDVSNPNHDHYGQAVKFDEEGDLVKASEAFHACARFAPSSEAWNNVGMALLNELEAVGAAPSGAADATRLTTKAREAFTSALKLDPRNADAQASLAELQEGESGGGGGGGQNDVGPGDGKDGSVESTIESMREIPDMETYAHKVVPPLPAASQVPRLPWGDEARALIAAQHAVVITGSGVLGKLAEKCKKWTYIENSFPADTIFKAFVHKQGRFRYGVNLPEVLKVWPNERDFTWWDNAQITMRQFRDFNINPPEKYGPNASMYIQQPLADTVGIEPGEDVETPVSQIKTAKTNRFWEDYKKEVNEELIGQIFKASGIKRTQKIQPLVWFSAKKASTPAHFDVLMNLFVQTAGTKRVHMFHPSNYSLMYPYPFSHPSSRQSQIDIRAPDVGAYPEYAKARPMVADVGPGDMLFIPPYWWHEIDAVGDMDGRHHTGSLAFWNDDFMPDKLTIDQRMTAAAQMVDSLLNVGFDGDRAAATVFAHRWSEGLPLSAAEQQGKEDVVEFVEKQMRREINALTTNEQDRSNVMELSHETIHLDTEFSLRGLEATILERFGSAEAFLKSTLKGRYGSVVARRNKYVADHARAVSVNAEGVALAKAGKLKKSLVLFQKAAKLAPDSALFLTNLLDNHLDLEDKQAARKYLLDFDRSLVELVGLNLESEEATLATVRQELGM